MKLGQAWDTDPRFKQAFHRFHSAVAILVVIAIAWFLWSHWRQRVRDAAQAA
jgi:hypothetical protein